MSTLSENTDLICRGDAWNSEKITQLQNVCPLMHANGCYSPNIPGVHVCMCVSYQQQEQHHVCMVAHTRHVQGGPQVFVLQVHVQASLNQNFCRKHVVMASTLQDESTADGIIITFQICTFPEALLTINSAHEWFTA